jgi:phosphoglycolate phosphatase
MPRPTIYLFDIDGTLLDGKGAGRRAMEAAFLEVVGSLDGLRRMGFGGMTDPAIVRAGLEHAGIEPEQTIIERVVEGYLARLPDAIAATRGYCLHAGVHAILDRLEALDDCAVGLGTGNVERGAELKLTPVGIHNRFAFGGFGSDHEDRPELIRIGAERGAARLGAPLHACRVVVIGDTPRDVDAACAIGAECLAVATSFYSMDVLREAGATVVAADLTAAECLAMLLDARDA